MISNITSYSESAEQEGVPNLPTGGLGEGTGEKVLLDQ